MGVKKGIGMDKSATEVKPYWLGLEEWENPEQAKELAKQEFLKPPQKQADELGLDRRSFMKFMGAATMMASLASCSRRPVQKIVPLVNKPEEITPGKANYYTSADPLTGQALILKTREGRPIKVDGNSSHPVFSSALGARGQASIYDLYDPDRLRKPSQGANSISWDILDEKASAALKDKDSTYFLTNTVLSLGEKKLIKQLCKTHYEYDSISMEDIRQGQRESFGVNVLPYFRFDRAKVIVSIDADFLDTMIAPESFTKDFSKTRDLTKNAIGELIVFESAFSLTGANADKRILIHPQHQLLIALSIAYEVALYIGVEGRDILNDFSPKKVESLVAIKASLLKEVSKKLIQNRGHSLLVAGGIAGKSSQAVALQNVVNFINASLRNDGNTIDYKSGFNLYKGSLSQVKSLIKAIESGKVNTLLIHGLNPVYDLPESLGFQKALKKVKNVIYVGSYMDETATASHYVAAESHPFESWGDVNPMNGFHSIQQPSIRPLFETRSFSDSMIVWAKAIGRSLPYKNSYELSRSIWRNVAAKLAVIDFEKFWIESLHKGFADILYFNQKEREEARSFRMPALASAVEKAKEVQQGLNNDGGFALVLKPSISIGDGRQANNAQLQEIPDPITKVTWGNYVSMSPAMAKKLAVKDSQVVRLKKDNVMAELPVLRQPGLKDNVIVVNLGYGRKMKGRIGNNLGVSMVNFLEPGAKNLSFTPFGVRIERTDKMDPIAVTQHHHSLESRDIAFETSLEEFKLNKSSGIVRHIKIQNIWSGHEYKGYRWGMSIDLNKCTGCSSCVMACQVENNVPVVGKNEVLRGREMHWIRIDRYYKGDPKDPQVVQQPMLCQHCENAPCETVCPVLATLHNSEGLNVMVYNRCVGTRYCSNNCPYKVRRFNFFEYNHGMNKKLEHPLSLLKNPEVTLRSRGVMEKCSFCIQRINVAKQDAKRESRNVRDGEIVPACQDACPSQAISFGNINDKLSQVSKERSDPRSFSSLEELNTKPSVTYMTKVWNRPSSGKDHSGGKH